MVVLSFDVGIKNLAFCIINNDQILHWKVFSIDPSLEKSLTDGPTHLIKILDTMPELLRTHLVLIEKQPSRNNKMRVIEALLHAYFIIKGTSSDLSTIKKVIIYSAKHKLGSETVRGKKGYSERKKLSVQRAKEFIERTHQAADMKHIFNSSKKKDDLADSLLQALAFTKNETHKEIEGSSEINSEIIKISCRKPTEKQEKSGYSKSNLKWLFQQSENREETFKQLKVTKSLKKLNWGQKSLPEIISCLQLNDTKCPAFCE